MILFSIREILDMAIQIEHNGETVYREAIGKISQPELASILRWMADEEVKHAQWFSNLKREVETNTANPFMEEMGRELFNELLGKKSFSHKEVNFYKIRQIDDLIAIFIEFENDTVLVYEMLEPFIEDQSTLAELQKIINEENKHIEQLQQFSGSAALSPGPDKL